MLCFRTHYRLFTVTWLCFDLITGSSVWPGFVLTSLLAHPLVLTGMSVTSLPVQPCRLAFFWPHYRLIRFTWLCYDLTTGSSVSPGFFYLPRLAFGFDGHQCHLALFCALLLSHQCHLALFCPHYRLIGVRWLCFDIITGSLVPPGFVFDLKLPLFLTVIGLALFCTYYTD